MLLENGLKAQQARFSKVLNNTYVSDMVQDKQGFVWFTTFDQGLKRYDGVNIKTYINDPRNPNTIAANTNVCLLIDEENMIWLSAMNKGVDRFDLATNTATHYRHDPKNPSSISSDTVICIMKDRSGYLWFGTFNGLDRLDLKTGKFTNYRNDPKDPGSLSQNTVNKVLEDKNGDIWVGCWAFPNMPDPTAGGLNKLNRKTGKFTRYLHDQLNPKSIYENMVSNLFEDRNGNFWVTTRSGVSLMDRSKGEFTRYYADPLKPDFGPAPVSGKFFFFSNSFSEDVKGNLWIATSVSGITRYDPITKAVAHFGPVFDSRGLLSGKDTATGLGSKNIVRAMNTRDGLLWLAAYDGNIFNLDYNKTAIPFFSINQEEANSFYCEDNNNILWIGTAKGLVRRDLTNQNEKVWIHDPGNANSLAAPKISSIKADKQGYLWLGTRGGLDKFDPRTGKFLHYKYDPKDSASLSNGNISYMVFDPNDNLWITSDSGISKMDKSTNRFTHYAKSRIARAGIHFSFMVCITADKEGNIWTAGDMGALRLDPKTGALRQYLPDNIMKSICVDTKGIIWAGGETGIYYLDKTKDEFILFAGGSSEVSVNSVINILEDDEKNLWVSTTSSIVKINADRTRLTKYTDANGVRFSAFFYNDNFKGKDGRLFLGELNGFYAFYPGQINEPQSGMQLNISGFKLKDKELKAGANDILKSPIWETAEIKLRYNQNVFSFDFFAVDYISPGDEKYTFMLENYDDDWHDIGNDHRAFFFNVPPGKYVFRVKAINGDGSSAEKSIRIFINPPWWKTWWAYCLYGLLFILVGYLVYKYQRSYIVKRERERTRQKELAQAKEIEKAYTALKETQTQLIQSEKMASLGELTAGIAHEIQNPLNFVNNFSEVNKELLIEMKDEIDHGNLAAAKNIANDIIDNEEKIIFHGKRADAIVKGMLQHSRSSSGKKEATDINALCDEYLRLAYHGLRARDKSFNAKFETIFDNSIGKINIMPQEIGRVILNLINNAFYAVSAKASATKDNSFIPTVTVSTHKKDNKVEVWVKDNGTGIPERELDKIFQPFFTTKPTGQGTGLGLSLSYDIIKKGHGGELKVFTREGEGTEFIIVLNEW
jgi:signal transduction histidine kinase/ligand-binding sensor domain-containing protein